MSRKMKNVVFAFTIICAIALIIFTVELVLENQGNADRDPGPTITHVPSAGNGDDDPDGPGGEEGPSENEGPNGGATQAGEDEPQEEQPPPSAGVRYEKPLLVDNKTLIFYSNEEVFEHSERGEGWELEYMGGGSASIEIAFLLVTPIGVEREAEIFLDRYLEGGESRAEGERPVGASSLVGFYTSGEKNGQTYEAWIHPLFNEGVDGIALVVVINYQNDAQKEAIFNVLDTLEMAVEQEQEEEGEQGH